MSNYNLTIFLEPSLTVRSSGKPNAVLYVEPDGWHGPGNTCFQIPQRVSAEDHVKIADAFLEGVTAWRDTIVAEVERNRTAADELAEARAEIERLKSDRDGGESNDN
ncbi:hypothetical protein U9R90_05490 [Streptomyces sp. E11-3]|uniref:hypothetical protein n=1 Tax=Streptomyces sp. E11-3 TaxID=3110112 RepID=UPI00397FAF28